MTISKLENVRGNMAENMDQVGRLLCPEAVGTGSDGRLVLMGSCCRSCGLRMSPPSLVCPGCGAQDLELEEQPREGVLYTFTVLHVVAPRWRKPMTLGYVDLPSKVRVLAHLAGQSHTVGGTVTLDIGEVGTNADGTPLRALVFRAAVQR